MEEYRKITNKVDEIIINKIARNLSEADELMQQAIKSESLLRLQMAKDLLDMCTDQARKIDNEYLMSLTTLSMSLCGLYQCVLSDTKWSNLDLDDKRSIEKTYGNGIETVDLMLGFARQKNNNRLIQDLQNQRSLLENAYNRIRTS